MSINLINASNGSGEAVLAVVNAARTAGSTTISVASTTNWPANFIATAGTELSGGILSAPLVFSGHLSGANTIVIDTIAPGYVDAGSSVGDVVVIKPTTMWADNIGTTLATSLNDNGSLKSAIVNYANLLSTIFSGQVSTISNTGSAGGTMSYINLGGIKICWGTTLVISSFNAPTYDINFPPSFFTTVIAQPIAVTGVVADVNQLVLWSAQPAPAGGSIYCSSIPNSSGAKLQATWIAIGT